jgi:hypothetical protein
MGFLKDSSSAETFYLEVTEEGTLNRPLSTKPQSMWVHKIQAVKTVGPNNQLTIVRPFSFETCTATGRNGAGCALCNTPDPLWHMLADDERTNRSGKRVDFPKTPRHFLPVFNHTLQAVRILEGGNQIFEEMDKWYDAQSPANQDLRRCDWQLSKAGKAKMTKYKSVRMDASAFSVTQELQNEAMALMQKAMEDRRPTEPAKLMAKIRGESSMPGLTDGMQGSVQAALPNYAQPAQLQANTMPQMDNVPLPVVTVPYQQFTQGPLPQVTPAAIPQTAVQPAVTAASQDILSAFTSWLNQQPEFQAMGVVHNFMPVVKEKFGTVEYSKLSADQLSTLRIALDNKLVELRTKKA